MQKAMRAIGVCCALALTMSNFAVTAMAAPATDNEFVTVKEKDQDVRVAKSNGNLIVHVLDKSKDGEKVDVTIPMKVVDALFSTVKDNELDVAAAIRALSDAGDAVLVTVQDATEHVRIWIDSHSASE